MPEVTTNAKAKVAKNTGFACRITVGDCVLVASLVLGSLLSLVPFATGHTDDDGPGEAIIQIDGAIAQRVPLTGHKQITLDVADGQMVLSVEPGRIRVQAVDCGRQLCMKQGWAANERDSIICVPNKTTINIETSELAEADGIHVITY